LKLLFMHNRSAVRRIASATRRTPLLFGAEDRVRASPATSLLLRNCC